MSKKGYKEIFSERVKEEMKLKGLKPKDMAETTELSLNAVWDAIEGRKSAGTTIAVRIAEALNVSVEYLLGLNNDKTISVEPPNDFDYRLFARVMKEEMELKGITKTDVVKGVGSNNASVNNWMNQKTQPILEKMIKIADALGVRLDYMLGFSEEK